MRKTNESGLLNELTADELLAVYKIVRENEESAPESDEEIYDDFYDEYEAPISKKVVRSVLKKIGNFLPKGQKEDVDKDFLRKKYHTYNNFVDEKVYAVLRKALDKLKSVNIEYFGMESAEFTKRKVDVYYTSSRYTIGYCHLRKDMRKFRTSRIAKAKIADSSYKIPRSFNKNDY
jgi:predicted DNA-binding transcriptional regulator YafY